MKIFNKEGLINNICNYIMITIILLIFILSILFKVKGYNNLKIRIIKISNIKFKNNPPIKKPRMNIMKNNNEFSNSDIKLKLTCIKVYNNIKINNNQIFNKKTLKKIREN